MFLKFVIRKILKGVNLFSHLKSGKFKLTARVISDTSTLWRGLSLFAVRVHQNLRCNRFQFHAFLLYESIVFGTGAIKT